jgi:hypothetical protein
MKYSIRLQPSLIHRPRETIAQHSLLCDAFHWWQASVGREIDVHCIYTVCTFQPKQQYSTPHLIQLCTAEKKTAYILLLKVFNHSIDSDLSIFVLCYTKRISAWIKYLLASEQYHSSVSQTLNPRSEMPWNQIASNKTVLNCTLGLSRA